MFYNVCEGLSVWAATCKVCRLLERVNEMPLAVGPYEEGWG